MGHDPRGASRPSRTFSGVSGTVASYQGISRCICQGVSVKAYLSRCICQGVSVKVYLIQDMCEAEAYLFAGAIDCEKAATRACNEVLLRVVL